jgi:hypothetical protein
MEIKYQLIESEKLFVQKFIGDYVFEEHIKYTKFITPFIIEHKIEKVLNDMRNLDSDNFDNIPGDLINVIERVAKFRKKIIKNELKNAEVTLVFWAEDPLPTLIAHIFTGNLSIENCSYFTCKEDVAKFLKLSDSVDLEEITKNLKNSFNSK